MSVSRARDGAYRALVCNRDGWRCQRCGVKHVAGSVGLHAAHCFRRNAAPSVRHDPDNGLALCGLTCHPYIDAHPDAKRALWVSAIGEERYEALAARAHGKRDRVMR